MSFLRQLALKPLPQQWEGVSFDTAGYCYLCLFDSENHQEVAHYLGAYPTWGSVKNLGGYRSDLSYLVTRTASDTVHIERSSVGTPPAHLRIRSHEYLGDHLRLHTSHIAPTTIGRGMPYFAVFWAASRLLGASISPLILFIGFVISYPTWILELVMGRLHYPNPVYYVERILSRAPAVSRFPSAGVLTRNLVKILAIASLPMTSARLTTKAHIKWGELDLVGVDLETIQRVHPNYVESFTKYGTDAEICSNNVSVRREILDLDVDDDVLVKYIEAMCPQLSDNSSWRLLAESLDRVNHSSNLGATISRMVAGSGVLMDKIIDDGSDLIYAATGVVDEHWRTTKEFVVEVMDDHPEVYLNTLHTLRTVVTESLSEMSDVTALVFGATKELYGEVFSILESNLSVPAATLRAAVEVMEVVGADVLSTVNYTQLALKNLTVDVLTLSDDHTNVEMIGEIANTLKVDSGEIVSNAYATVNMILKTISGSCHTPKDCEKAIKLVFGKGVDVVDETYGLLKAGVLEIDPYQHISNVTDAGTEVVSKVTDTVGNMIFGTLGRVVPGMSSIERMKQLAVGKSTTPMERILRSKYRSKSLIDYFMNSKFDDKVEQELITHMVKELNPEFDEDATSVNARDKKEKK